MDQQEFDKLFMERVAAKIAATIKKHQIKKGQITICYPTDSTDSTNDEGKSWRDRPPLL